MTNPIPTGVTPRTPITHRATASSCAGVYSPPEPPSDRAPYVSGCTRHAECTERMNGKCTNGTGSMDRFYYCVYDECTTDADCDSGMMCHCTASSVARCMYEGNCRVDADCGGTAYNFCSPSMGSDCGGYHTIAGYYCHTPLDSCIEDSDCIGSDYCNYNEYEARWGCTPIDNLCAIG